MKITIHVSFPGQWWWATKDMGLAPEGPAGGPIRWDVVGSTVAETVRAAEDRLQGLRLTPDEELVHGSVLVALPEDLSDDEQAVVRRWVSENDGVDGAPEHRPSFMAACCGGGSGCRLPRPSRRSHSGDKGAAGRTCCSRGRRSRHQTRPVHPVGSFQPLMDPSPSPHGAKGLAGFGGLPWDRIIEYAIESATRVVGPDDAEDVAQEVVTRLIAQERDGEAVINPQAFIRFVTHRAAIDRLRSERARSERNRRVADRAALFEPDIAEAVVAHHELVDMLDGLSPRMRDVAYLRLVDGLTQTEIAARLGISQGTVSALLARVRASLVESVRGEAE